MPRLDGMSSRSMTFDASSGHYADPDGLKTTISSATTAQSYSGAALNGTNVCGGGKTGLASWPSVTSSSTVGAFNAGSAITFTGTYDGAAVTRTALLTAANGNETVLADGPLDIGSVTVITVAAQADTDGSFTFGWSGIAPQASRQSWRVVVREAGSIVVANGGEQDTVLLPIHGAHEAWVRRIYANTTIDVTVYE